MEAEPTCLTPAEEDTRVVVVGPCQLPPRHRCDECHLWYDEEFEPPSPASSPPPPPFAELIPASVARRVESWSASPSTAVLHLDDLVKKLDVNQLRYVLNKAIAAEPPVQVAYLQGALPLQGPFFSTLLDWLKMGHIWAVNLGELNFSRPQMSALFATIKESNVTHMFYECTVAGEWKEEFKDAIRANRAKHGRWRLSRDHVQNHVIMQVNKNWFNPTSHLVNKLFVDRNTQGWPSGTDRVQCERCRKWRRLPTGVTRWPREFECADAYWDAQASCEVVEERALAERRADRAPEAGDVIVVELRPGQWATAQCLRTPTPKEWTYLRRQHPAVVAREAPPAVEDQLPREVLTSLGIRSRAAPKLFVAGPSVSDSKNRRQREAEVEAQRAEWRLVACAVDVADRWDDAESDLSSAHADADEDDDAGNGEGRPEPCEAHPHGARATQPRHFCVRVTGALNGSSWCFLHDWGRMKRDLQAKMARDLPCPPTEQGEGAPAETPTAPVPDPRESSVGAAAHWAEPPAASAEAKGPTTGPVRGSSVAVLRSRSGATRFRPGLEWAEGVVTEASGGGMFSVRFTDGRTNSFPLTAAGLVER